MIEDRAGKTFKKKALEFPSKFNDNLEKYKVGDRVLHLYGTAITIVLPTASDTRCCCCMCGWSNDMLNDTCTSCGFPLIKLIE